MGGILGRIKRKLIRECRTIKNLIRFLLNRSARKAHKKIYLILTVRNESYYLPSFLAHITKYVDGIVALDDGSTDNTVEILRAEKKTLDVLECEKHTSLDWDERGNREKTIRRAYELGADWVLCADPDERFEERFLKKLRFYAGLENCCYNLRFRELWGDYDTWRCDGVWGMKRKDIFFPLSETMTFKHKNSHHFTWAYAEIVKKRRFINDSMYHLKMIKEADRKMRSELYNSLDPNKTMLARGYDYLVDNTGLEIKTIREKNRYDFDCIPEDLKR